MSKLQAISSLDEKQLKVVALIDPVEKVQKKEWKPSAIVSDIATLGTGTLLAAVFNVGLVFVVPRLISVEDFGYWRLFALYAGYVGFLHFGFSDGVLLRWAGRDLREYHHEIGPALRYLLWQHALVLLPLSLVASLMLSGPLRFVAIGVAAYAIIFNCVTVLQFGLQSAKIFRPVAVSTIIPPAFFLALALAWHLRWQTSYREITTFYAAGWLVALVFLAKHVKPWAGDNGKHIMDLAKRCVLAGWPIVLANTAVMMIIYADRLAVSWSASIQEFAQYSLAGSAMAVPITAIQACSKVFFSHLAGVTPEGRKRIYGISSRVLLIAWAVLLPYFFALSLFIRHFLPKYIPSLLYARILLLAIPFLAAIQILQMSFVYLNGMQKRFLWHSVVVLAITLGISSIAAFGTESLQLVAGAQVVILGVWWLFNEWRLRKLTGEQLCGSLRFLGGYLLVSASYWVITGASMAQRPILGALIYYVCSVIFLVLLCSSDLLTGIRMFRHQNRIEGISA
jgi:O-antigen/teichoic acid export membrane protein